MEGTAMFDIPYPPEPYTAEKRVENGNPVLLVNGKRAAPMIYALSDIPASNPLTAQAQRNIANFAAQGIDLVSTDVPLYRGWRKNTPFNPDFLIGDLTAILETNPKAGIILRLHVNAPYWWMRDNPDELCVFGTGDAPYVDRGEYERMIIGDEENDMRASLASEKWKADAGQKLGELLRAIYGTPQGRHVVGIQIAGGVYGEWHQWGFKFDPDYGKCMTEYFRKYLRGKYGDVQSLRAAWRDESADFDTAVPAPPGLRRGLGAAPFRDPAAGQYVVDSLMAQMRCAPDAIIYFSDIIRKLWTRPLLIGVFYGYYDSWDSLYVSGHLDVEYLSASGAVDYFSAPFRYDSALRGPGGVASARGMLESERLNGILWLTEMDNPPLGSAKSVGGDPEKRAESIAILRRNVLEPITRGMGMWFFDHRLVLETGMGCTIYVKKGWWDHPELLKEVRMLRRIGERCAGRDYRAEADVLLVFDTESRYYSNAHGAFSGENERALYLAVGKSGAAYDSIYLHDLRKADIARYRCVIFVDADRITGEMRDYIENSVAADGRHIIWVGTNGYIDENGIGAANISAAAGISVETSASRGAMRCKTAAGETDIVPALQYSLVFRVADREAEPVAEFADTGETAAAVRRAERCTRWYFAYFPADGGVLREIFREAGAFIYSENGEALLAGNGLAAVTTEGPAEVVLRLRSGAVVREAVAGAATAVYDSETGERLDIKYSD